VVATNIVGCIKKGTLAELPTHAAYLADYLYYVSSGTGAGDLYWNNGSAWVLLQGAAKAEILQNKTIEPSANSFTNMVLDPFLSQKRQGFITPSLTAQGSLKYALKGLPNLGTYSLFFVNTTEKYISRFTASSATVVGYQSNSTTKFITKRSLNPSLKIRCRCTSSTEARLNVGFSTRLPTNFDSHSVNATNAGVTMGFALDSPNFFTRRSDGTTATHTETTIPRDTLFRTFEISMSATNVVTKIDDVIMFTHTTNLPPLETEIYLLAEMHNITGTNNFDIAKAVFSSD
jgi:hypothetical protein